MAGKARKHQTPLSKIRQYVYAWQRSGLSQTEYEQKMNLTKGSINRWVYRIKHSDEEVATPAKSHLRPIKIISSNLIADSTSGKEIIEIILNDKLRVRFSAAIEVYKIAALLKELQSCS